jgi:hypothetical protein
VLLAFVILLISYSDPYSNYFFLHLVLYGIAFGKIMFI